MKDMSNPTPQQIRDWAYTTDAVEPCQDWDLVLSWAQVEKVFFDLASEDHCPNRRFILRILYLIVGDAVRTNFGSKPRYAVEGLIEKSNAYHHPDIERWRKKSLELLKHPENFDYAIWCGGGLAN